MDTKQHVFVVSITTKEDGYKQLEQLLEEEKNTKFLEKFSIIDLNTHLGELKKEHMEFAKERIPEMGWCYDGIENPTEEDKIISIMEIQPASAEEHTIYELGEREIIDLLIRQANSK